MSSYSLTKSRAFQYVGILLALAAIAAGYWYFSVRAGVKTNTSGSQPQGVGDLSAGLAGYWKLDENTGTSAADASVNGNNGTLTNGPTWTTGRIGTGVTLDGTNDYITGATPSLDVPVTLCTWFKISATSNVFDNTAQGDVAAMLRSGATNYEALVIGISNDVGGQAHAYAAALDNADGNFSAAIGTTNLWTAGDTWQHICGVFSSSTSRQLYLNGVLEGTNTGSENVQVSNLFSGVGTNSTAFVDYAKGVVDETRVYSRALSSDEVANLYRLTAPTGVDTSLKGYWSFDGGALSGTNAYDWSGAGNNGTLTNGPVATNGRIGQGMGFDGTNDYVGMGSPANLDDISNLTVCTWARSFDTNAGAFVSKDATVTGWYFGVDGTDNSLNVFSGWSGGPGYAHWNTGSGTLPANEWAHLCFVYNRTSTANDPVVYVNAVAVPVTEVQTPSGTMESDAPMNINIGSYDNGVSDFFAGEIDEVRIYNRLFTAAEIQSLYDRSAPDKTNTSAVQAQGGSNPAAGLALYWPLDDGSGTNADDKSANANDGTLTNGPTFTTGQIGGAVDFDGTNDYIAVADPASGILDFTNMDSGGTPGDLWSLSLWFNRDTATTDDTLIAKKNSQTTGTDDGYIVWIDDATDKINVRVDDAVDGDHSEIESSTTYTATGWHQLTVVFDEVHQVSAASDQRCPVIFVDGADVTDLATCFNYLHYSVDLSNALAFTVGAESDGGNPFDGKLDDVRVYNRPISTSEVSQLYRTTATTTGIDTGLRGYWNFDGLDAAPTTPNTVYDRSGAGNEGVFTNSPALARGRVGQGVDFFPNGADNDAYITMGDPSSGSLDFGSGDFSVGLWAKVRGYSNQGSCCNFLASKYNADAGTAPGYGIYYSSGNVPIFSIHDGTNETAATGTTDLRSGWHHIVGVRSGTTTYLYVDGVLEKTATGSTGSVSNSENFYIGASGTVSQRNPNAIVDEARVYARALTAAEVKAQYDAAAPDKTNTSASTPQGTGRLDSGLVGYWKLDENTGTSAGDTSTGGNTGTITNGPTWTTGRIGSALSFDGTNDYVTMGDIAAAEGGNQVTAAAWIKQNGSTNERHVLDKGGCTGSSTNSWELMVISGEPVFYIPAYGGSATGAGVNVSDNAWHHLVGTYDGVTIRIYSDGSLVGTQAASVTLGSDTSAVEVGGNCNGGGSCAGSCYWNGQIDEARVYDRALSDDEIRQLYRLSTPTGTDTSLKGYWSFNGADMNGTTAYDRSGAGNDGALTGMTAQNAASRGKLGQAIRQTQSVYQVVTVSGLMGTPANITLSGWVKVDQLDAGGAGFIELGDHVGLIANKGGKVHGYFYESGSTWPATDYTINITGTGWHHLAYTFDDTANTQVVYVDGVAAASSAHTASINWAGLGSNTILGDNTGNTDYQLYGSMDEVRIHSRALSASEIQALYNSGR